MSEKTCNGAVYRFKINSFINAKGEVVETSRMIPMKRLSCKGCENCGDKSEMLSEWMSEGNTPDLGNCVNNGLYVLLVDVTSRDFETGHADDWDMIFLPTEPS